MTLNYIKATSVNIMSKEEGGKNELFILDSFLKYYINTFSKYELSVRKNQLHIQYDLPYVPKIHLKII